MTVVAERLSNPGRATFEMRLGKRRGVVHWAVREIALRGAASIAPIVFTYHFSLLLSRP